MNTKKKNARGITLIALVITIIVLLILAGVTINALSGENGIITKSKEAKIKTEKSKTIEKINLAILTAMTKGDGDIDNATLREELEKEGLTVKTEGNNLPWDVSDGKYIYRINEDYTVEEVEGINLSKKEIKLASGENETITAKVEGTEYQATCTVKIIQKITTITAGNIEMNIGDTQKINVTTTPTEGLIEDLEYTSGSPTIATVGADGNVKGIAEGTAVITIRGKNSGVSTTCTIKVTPKVIKITKITASGLTLEPGKTGKLSVTIEPTNQTEGVTYTSGTQSVATVGQDGTVNALTEGTTIITVKGKVSGVSTTCRVTVKSNKINGAIEVGEYEKYYGKKVTNYTAGGKTYRIFYIDTEGKFGDKNTVYLKADWTSNDTTLSSYTSYTPSGTDLTTYKRLNPSWAAKRGSSTSSWNYNEHAAAWLCSPSKWTTYCDTSKANYAIGSPTAEMYVASYNQVSHTTGNYKLGATYRATDYPGYIYTLNGKQSNITNSDYYTGDNTLDYTGYNSMYCGRKGSKGDYWWWLASPSSGYSGAVCNVYGSNATLIDNGCSGTCGVAPLVSLKSGIQVEIEE